ncbi:phosphoribosylaminoimidazolesuccinocarboxamide (SAICAR) synthase, partial [Rhizobium sp. CF122]|uniref:phosphoribosylaminoimidazolesuccinocarboxamide synthase n=1 Tax=Rhizobium sp. CF122 TaxID=1144312 RepID=UPI0002715CD5
ASRYWLADSYQASFEAGTRPTSFDKDFVRAWVAERCDPYKDEIPEIPVELIQQTSEVYIKAYESITAQHFVPDDSGATPVERIRKSLSAYFS